MKEVLLIIVATAAILLWQLMQSGSHASPKAPRIKCASDLRQMGLAFLVWAGDNNNHFPMQSFTNTPGAMEFPNASNMFRYFQVMSNQLVDPKILICPTDRRKPAKDFSSLKNENLSYFVGFDAVESQTNMLLTGDRNLVVDGLAVGTGLLTLSATDQVGWSATMHKGGGNVGFADGSVQQLTSSGLRAAIAHSGTNVNRLAVP